MKRSSKSFFLLFFAIWPWLHLFALANYRSVQAEKDLYFHSFNQKRPYTSVVVRTSPRDLLPQAPEFDPTTLSGEDLYKYYIFEITKQYENVDPELVISLVERESDFQPAATNSKGTCIGLMQICPKYHMQRARELGVKDLRDPYGNLLTGIDLLSDLIDMADGDISYALMLYNMKTKDANALHAKGKTTPYVRTILARQEEIKKEVSSYGKTALA